METRIFILLSLLLASFLSNAETIKFTSINKISESYGKANHQNPKWQQLASYENGKAQDPFGISWSTDNGLSWGRDAIIGGSNVIFKMNMFKSTVGTHYADHVKMWIDFDNNGFFSNSESMLYGEQDLDENEYYNIGNNRPYVQSYEFISKVIHIGHEHEGGYLSLRGRTVCSESLVYSVGGRWHDQFKNKYKKKYNKIFSPTRSYYQGESEDWSIPVYAFNSSTDGSTNPRVPLSGTFLLMLLGIPFLYRKFKN